MCRPPLFAVTDGMGGAQAGDLAARLAAETLAELDPDGRGETALATQLRIANTRIFERSLAEPGTAGMGTTGTVALVDEDGASLALAHVGDSRAYRLREGALEQLTTDHSLVGELVRSGRLQPEEADMHPARNVVTRALGTEPDVDVDTATVEAQVGDVYLLCSDGLTTMLDDDAIAGLIGDFSTEPQAAAQALVDAANAAGGEDNITVVLFEIEEGEPEERAAREVGVDDEDDAQALAPRPEEPATPASDGAVRRHGAGAGNRLAALALIGVAVAVMVLILVLGLR